MRQDVHSINIKNIQTAAVVVITPSLQLWNRALRVYFNEELRQNQWEYLKLG